VRGGISNSDGHVPMGPDAAHPLCEDYSQTAYLGTGRARGTSLDQINPSASQFIKGVPGFDRDAAP